MQVKCPVCNRTILANLWDHLNNKCKKLSVKIRKQMKHNSVLITVNTLRGKNE